MTDTIWPQKLKYIFKDRKDALKHLRKKIVKAALTRKQMRVVIAKDVIASIYLQRIRPKTGSYIDAGPDFDRILQKVKPLDDVRAFVPKMVDCRVCALGACFIATVARFDRTRFVDILSHPVAGLHQTLGAAHPSQLRYQLREYFTLKELVLIEDLYEGFSDTQLINIVRDDSNRLEVLMRNIISHQGNFKPPKAWLGEYSNTHYKPRVG